jgi:hypothetical protein
MNTGSMNNVRRVEVNSHLSVPFQSRLVRIREKDATEPDMSERVHNNIWQRYFLALHYTTRLNGVVFGQFSCTTCSKYYLTNFLLENGLLSLANM